MTVDELIEHLRMLPPDAEVLVCDALAEGAECGGVGGVYLETYRVMGRERAIRTAIIAVRPESRSPAREDLAGSGAAPFPSWDLPSSVHDGASTETGRSPRLSV